MRLRDGREARGVPIGSPGEAPNPTVVRRLIVEHDVTPISPNWKTVVQDAEAHFRDVQKKRFSND